MIFKISLISNIRDLLVIVFIEFSNVVQFFLSKIQVEHTAASSTLIHIIFVEELNKKVISLAIRMIDLSLPIIDTLERGGTIKE